MITSLSKRKIPFALAFDEPYFEDEVEHLAKRVFRRWDNEHVHTKNKLDNGTLSKIFNSEYERHKHFNLKISNNEIENKLLDLEKFFNYIYDEVKISLIVWELSSNALSEMAIALKPRKAKFFGVVSSRISSHFEIYPSNEFKDFNYLDSISIHKPNEIDKFLDSKPDYMSYKKKIFNYYYDKFYYIFINSKKNKTSFYSSKLYIDLKRQIVKISALINKFLFRFDEYKNHKNYFFFPLSVRPESTSSIYGFHNYDDIETIRLISNNLPKNFMLFVKQHPDDLSRNSSFYSCIRKIPFVRILQPSLNSIDLIKNSVGVITHSGTAGFESILYQKPVILLGKANYEFHKNVRKVKTILDLHNELRNISNGKYIFKNNDKKEFLQKYKKYVFEGVLDINNIGYKTFNNKRIDTINNLVDLIEHIYAK